MKRRPPLAERLRRISRLRPVLYPLDAPPSGPAWNQDNLADLLQPAARLAEAAVLVGLVQRAGAIHVVLTRRSDSLRKHGGQVAFPGGRVDPEDADAIAAAVRETGEEVGIPAHQIVPLGLLDPLATISHFRILPVVAAIEPGFVARPNPDEVAEVFEVPLRYLLDPSNLVHRQIEYQGRPREIVEYRYPEQRIWGATAAILYNLRQRLESVR